MKSLAATLLLLLSLPVEAQEAAREEVPRGAFGEVVDVRLIDVEVVVTDRQGERVTGLAEADFRLFVDGEETEVAFFDEVREGRLASGEPAATHYLLFIDDGLSETHGRNRVLAGIGDQLDALGPADRMAIVAYSGSRLGVLLPWSGDRAEIAAALAAAARHRAAPPPPAFVFAERLRATYRALATALRAFADAPGRRVALVLSGGWPYEVRGGDYGLAGRSQLWDARGPLWQVADTANATGFTLYTVETAGLETPVPGGSVAAIPGGLLTAGATGGLAGGDSRGGPIDVSQPSLGNGAEGSAIAELNVYQGELDAAWGQFEEESTLLLLAERTGGRAMLNSRRLTALGRAAADLGDYYHLGFYHRRLGDGKNRRLRVEVAGRPDLRVRARAGFVDLPPSAEARYVTERALLFAGLAAGAPELAVVLGEPMPSRGRVELPFTVTVPLDELTLMADGAGEAHVRLELQVAVEDDRRRRSELAAVPLDLVLDADDLAAGEIVYDASLRLRARPHLLVFTVADAATGSALVARAEFDPDERQAAVGGGR